MYAKTTTVFQMEATECGAACLGMILNYWGCYVPLEQLRLDIGVSRDGCNARNIMIGSRKYGLKARGFRKEPEQLKKLKMPCIIHWNFNHFVVLEGFRGKHAILNDPAFGRRRITMADLDECFTGIVLTFEKTDAFEMHPKPHHFSRFIVNLLSKHTRDLLAFLALGILLILPGVVIPVLNQVFIDRVLFAGNTNIGNVLIAALFLVVLLKCGLTLYRDTLLEKLKNKVSLLSAHAFFSHLFRLPMNFYDQRSLGDLVGRNENNDNVNQFLMGNATGAVLDLFTAVFYFILLLMYSPLLTLIGSLGMLSTLAIARVSSIHMAAATEKQQVDEGKLSGMVYSGMRIIDTLKASGVENDYCARVIGQQAKSAELEQKTGKAQHVLNACSNVVEQLTSVLVLVVGGMLVINGDITAGMLVSITALLDSFTNPLQTLISFLQQLHSLRADMGRVDDVMKHKTIDEITSETSITIAAAKLKGNIELSNVSFGYSSLEAPLIEGISLSLMPGQSIALVGASGSGKSTIGKIVSGLYPIWNGEIRFDGVAYAQIPKHIIHSSISTVSQNIVLFSGSIKDNLTLWNCNVLESDYIRAAKDACIHDIITGKPGAYEYHLSEDGANLSGGQRQRLEIARALALNPSILIMDEATSALDPTTEKKIVDNIKRRGCTCIVIAHRLSAIRDCDTIVVLDRGRIVQQGNHDTLVHEEGLYRDLIKNM